MTLKINQNFKSIINNQLINSHKLSYTFQIFNNKLLINRFDYDEVQKILNKNFHKYKVLQSQYDQKMIIYMNINNNN